MILPRQCFLLLLVSLVVIHRASSLSLSSPKKLAPPSHLFISGLGYCGTEIAARFRETFPECKISGSVRSVERKNAMLAHPHSPWSNVHILDLDDQYLGLDVDGLSDLLQATHIIQTVAPIADFDRDPLLALHGSKIQESKNLVWVGYLSSTGVYGNYDGAWVSEDSELRCTDNKSLARVEAEKEWQLLEIDEGGPRIDCFRCGGIYGPGRGPLFAPDREIKASLGEPLMDDGSLPKYVNRILVDDICGAMLAAVSSDRPRHAGRAFNLVDDDPAPRQSVIVEARRLRGLDEEQVPSPSEEASGSVMPNKRRPSRGTGNKRCRNDRLKEEYGWQLKAPTFREGLALLYASQQRQILE
jgi:nucleoside-diphosphate-sugar epimerase